MNLQRSFLIHKRSSRRAHLDIAVQANGCTLRNHKHFRTHTERNCARRRLLDRKYEYENALALWNSYASLWNDLEYRLHHTKRRRIDSNICSGNNLNLHDFQNNLYKKISMEYWNIKVWGYINVIWSFRVDIINYVSCKR